tara:strand:- start:1077 stop:3326 length:2250 start_codon:yes stop_codon:yes gene_type:complete
MSDTEISFYKNIDIEYFFDGKVFDYLYKKYRDYDNTSKKDNTDNTAKLKTTLEENFKETLKGNNKIDENQKPENNIYNYIKNFLYEQVDTIHNESNKYLFVHFSNKDSSRQAPSNELKSIYIWNDNTININGEYKVKPNIHFMSINVYNNINETLEKYKQRINTNIQKIFSNVEKEYIEYQNRKSVSSSSADFLITPFNRIVFFGKTKDEIFVPYFDNNNKIDTKETDKFYKSNYYKTFKKNIDNIVSFTTTLNNSNKLSQKISINKNTFEIPNNLKYRNKFEPLLLLQNENKTVKELQTKYNYTLFILNFLYDFFILNKKGLIELDSLQILKSDDFKAFTIDYILTHLPIKEETNMYFDKIFVSKDYNEILNNIKKNHKSNDIKIYTREKLNNNSKSPYVINTVEYNEGPALVVTFKDLDGKYIINMNISNKDINLPLQVNINKKNEKKIIKGLIYKSDKQGNSNYKFTQLKTSNLNITNYDKKKFYYLEDMKININLIKDYVKFIDKKKKYNNKELTNFIIELLTSKTKLEQLYTYYKQIKKDNSVIQDKVYELTLELLFRKGNTFFINTNETTKEGIYEIDNYKILDEDYNYNQYNDTQIIENFLKIINNNELIEFCKKKNFDKAFKSIEKINEPTDQETKNYYNYVYNYLYKQTKNQDKSKFKQIDLNNIPVNILLKKKEKDVIKDKKKDKTCKAIYERLKGTMKSSSKHFNNVRKLYLAKVLLGGKKTKKIKRRKNKKRTIKNY